MNPDHAHFAEWDAAYVIGALCALAACCPPWLLASCAALEEAEGVTSSVSGRGSSAASLRRRTKELADRCAMSSRGIPCWKLREGEGDERGGARLRRAESLDLTGLHPALAAAEIVIACDVDNPLTGARGAAAVYGPQKGAGPGEVELLDTALARWADVVAEATGEDHRDDPGAGAAGGVGFGLVAVLGATMRPGAELVFELTGLPDTLTAADLVVTGEGSLDTQTLHGKAPAAVAALARDKGVRVVAVAGQVLLTHGELAAAGFDAAYALVDDAPTRQAALDDPGPILERIGARIAREHLGATR